MLFLTMQDPFFLAIFFITDVSLMMFQFYKVITDIGNANFHEVSSVLSNDVK